MSGQLRNFVFTLNNYTEVDKSQLLCFNCKYMLFAEEVAPTTGTPHLQGYCELNERIRFAKLISLLPEGIHIEPRKGTQAQAISYIKTPKDKPTPNSEQIHEVGEPRTQGTDVGPSALETARDLLRQDKSIDPEIHEIGVIKAYERLQRYWPARRSYSDDELSRIWIYGPGGSGKTSAAYLHARPYRTYKCDLFTKGWLDGYDNHASVILDDLVPNHEDEDQFKLLLSMLDRYPLRVNVKGSSVNWNPKRVIITSQKPPWDYYGEMWVKNRDDPEYWNTHVQLRQLMRRLDAVIALKGDTRVRYPAVITLDESEVSGIVLPRNFSLGTSGKRIVQDYRELKCLKDTDDSLDAAGDSSPGQDCVGQEQWLQEEEDCLQEHPISTPVPLADPD